MELINNTVRLIGKREYLKSLKYFLEQYTEKIEYGKDDIICINLKKDVQTVYDEKVIEKIRSYPSSSFWFDYEWCDIGSPFFGDILEYDTLYLKIDENSACNIIAEISLLFPKIEFDLSWEPQSVLYAKFGTAKIKAGEVLEYDDTIPKWYIDHLEEIGAFDDSKEGDLDSTLDKPTQEPDCFIDENGELICLPF